MANHEAAGTESKSIVPRLIFSIVALITLVSLGLAGGAVFFERQRRITDIEVQAARTADFLARTLSFPVWNVVSREIAIQLEWTLQNPAARGVELRFKDLTPSLIALWKDDNGNLENKRPVTVFRLITEKREITAEGKTIATLELYFSAAAADSQVLAQSALIAATVFAIDGTLVLVLFLILNSLVLRPLKRIERWAVEVSGGETVPPSMGKAMGEIASLHSSIYRMVTLLDDRYRIIEVRERELRLALTQKETLIQELFHRTRNSLQLVSSMLSLRAGKAEEPAVQKELLSLQRRVLSLALAQDMLFEKSDLSAVDLGTYLSTLAQSLVDNAGPLRDRVTMHVEAESVSVLIDTAVPFGQLVCELVSNSLDHAFPGDRRGEIRLRLEKTDDDFIDLTVRDDGEGPGASFNPEEDAGLGLEAVLALGKRQLRGTFTFDFSAGFACRFRFQEMNQKRRV